MRKLHFPPPNLPSIPNFRTITSVSLLLPWVFTVSRLIFGKISARYQHHSSCLKSKQNPSPHFLLSSTAGRASN